MPGPSWSPWRNLKPPTITRSSAFPSVGCHVICIFGNRILCSRNFTFKWTLLRPEDHDRASKEPILCDEKAVYRRPAESDHKLQRVQPSRQRVLQVRQHAGEIFLLQTEGSWAYWKVTGLRLSNKGPVRNCRECDFTHTHRHAYKHIFTSTHPNLFKCAAFNFGFLYLWGSAPTVTF